MKEFYLRNKIFFDKALLLLGVVALCFAAVFAMSFVAPFVAGLVIGLILSPLASFFQRKWRIPRGVSAAVLVLVFLGAIAAIGTIAVNRLLEEIGKLMQYVPQYIASLRQNVEQAATSLGLDMGFEDISARVLAFSGDFLQNLMAGGDFLRAIPSTIFRIILAMLSAFFFIKDGPLIKERLASLFPAQIRNQGHKVGTGLGRALGGWLRGQLIIMSIIGAICIVGLFILRSPYAIFAGLGIAVFDIIPILGAGGILIPWAIISFVSGNTGFGAGLLVISVLCFIARQTLEPRIVGKRIGLHPIVLLMAIYLGITALGPIGILAGPFIVLVIKIILETKQ